MIDVGRCAGRSKRKLLVANTTLERTVNHRVRFVLAMDRVLAEAQWRLWPAAQPGR
jgi:hypothetical protein